MSYEKELISIITSTNVEKLQKFCDKVLKMTESERLDHIVDMVGEEMKYNNPYGIAIMLRDLEEKFSEPQLIKQKHVDITVIYKSGAFTTSTSHAHTFKGEFLVKYNGTPVEKTFTVRRKIQIEKFVSVEKVSRAILNTLYQEVEKLSWYGFGMDRMHNWVMGEPEKTKEEMLAWTGRFISYAGTDQKNLETMLEMILTSHFVHGSTVPIDVFRNLLNLHTRTMQFESMSLFDWKKLDAYGAYIMRKTKIALIADDNGEYILTNQHSNAYKRVMLADALTV